MRAFSLRTLLSLFSLALVSLMGACSDDESVSPTTTTTTASSVGSGGSGGIAQGGAGGGGGEGGSEGGAGGMAPFELTIPGFSAGEIYPEKYECPNCGNGGMNLSPELHWSPGPPGTMSYAIVMRDLDFMSGFIHWVIWDLPAGTSSLGEGVPEGFLPGPPAPPGTKQAPFNAQLHGYLGMCSCNSVNTYEFTIYAIPSETLAGLDESSTKAEAEAAIVAAAIASASIEGES